MSVQFLKFQLLLCAIVLLISTNGFSQQMATADTLIAQPQTPKFKNWDIQKINLVFGVDFGAFNPIATERDKYIGVEQLQQDSASVWINRNTSANLSKQHRVGNISFYVQANFWKGLFVGMNYHFFSINSYKKNPNLGNLLSKKNTLFFLVAAKFGYTFEFLKNKCLIVEPALHIGGYTADDYYDSGKGKKFYVGLDCKVKYLIKRKFGFSTGIQYDYISYKKKEQNAVFNQQQIQKTTFNNFYLTAGICYNVTIRTKK